MLKTSISLKRGIPVGLFGDMFRGKRDKERDDLLERASRIQVGVLPNQIPRIDGYDIQIYSQSAKALSGDYYDFLLDEKEKRMEVICMDVSGKDLPAAITATQLAGAMYVLFKVPDMDISEKLAWLNALMYERTRRETFVTAMLIRLDFDKHEISWTNAGHNPLVVWEGRSEEKTGKIAPAIGFVEDAAFRAAVRTYTFPIEPGMIVLTYTDGVNEAMDNKRNEYGKERLLKIIHDNHEKALGLSMRALQVDLDNHESGQDPSDDRTVIAIKRNK